MEFDNTDTVRYGNERMFPEYMQKIRTCIRTILAGLQGTPYPISYSEQELVLHAYMCRMYGDSWLQTKSPEPHYIGPSSVPLKMENIIPSSEKNILTQYTVTEKADGDRALMYVSNEGKIYLITYNLKVIFTGSRTKEKR